MLALRITQAWKKDGLVHFVLLVLDKEKNESSYKCHGNPSQVCDGWKKPLLFPTVLQMRLSK